MSFGSPSISAHMTPHPHTIGKSQTMAQAAAVMRSHGMRHLPVLDGGQLVGIVSDRDIGLIAAMDGVDVGSMPVEEAMTAEPYFVEPTTPLVEVVRAMAEHKYGAAIVVHDRHVVGIFTAIDALRILASMLPS